MKFGAVAIGRNEGKRLQYCLASLSSATTIVYVDSGSTDGSVRWARDHGAEVISLDSSIPFTAARARNAGFARLKKLIADLTYVQFIDGDCQLVEGWSESALTFLDQHPDVGAVCGRRQERHPERSIYNWICDQEWNGPPGEARAFGGDVMMRTRAFEATRGYRDQLVAGEDPELSVRMRAAGWRIWRLDTHMTVHDAAMTRFAQWWRRSVRSGYVYAQGADLHGAPPELHLVWESRRAWFWGIGVPLICLGSGLAFGPFGWLAWLIYPLQVIRQTKRNRGPLSASRYISHVSDTGAVS